jgi:hypothetical protein
MVNTELLFAKMIVPTVARLLPSRRRHIFLADLQAQAVQSQREWLIPIVAGEYTRPTCTLINYAWLAVFAVGIALRVFALGTSSLSYDEAFTMLVAKAPLWNSLSATAGDVHPPLFYLIEWAIVRMAGASPLALRAPSALFGVVGLWLAARLAGTLRLGDAAQLIGVGLMAVLPFQLHYSQDARMYTLLQALVLWSLIAMLERRGWQLCTALTLMLWTHNYGVIYLAVIASLAILREFAQPVHVSADRPMRDAARFIPLVWQCLLLPVALYLPWAWVLAMQLNDLTATGYWIQAGGLGTFLYPLYALWWGATLPTGWPEIAAIITFGLLFFAVIKAFKVRDRSSLLLTMLTWAPPILAMLASAVWQPIYLFRALIGVAAPMYLLVAWAVTHRVDWRATAYAVAVCVPFIVAGLLNRGNLQILKGTSEQVQDYIAAHAQPGDVIVHGNVSSMLGFAASGYPDLPQYLMPTKPGSVGTLSGLTRRELGLREASLAYMSWKRAWLVWGAVPTIAAADDAAIVELLGQYEHEQIINLDDIFTGDNATVDGGVWLLHNSPKH